MSDDTAWILGIDDAGETHRLTSAELPLYIGGGPDDGVRIVGLPPAALQVGLLDGRLFILPGPGGVRPTVNDAPLTETRWLREGDRIELAGRRLDCERTDGRFLLRVAGLGSAGDTRPPDLDALAREAAASNVSGATPRAAEGETITPVAQRTRRGPAERKKRSRLLNPFAVAVWGVLAVLLVLAWFAFTAKSVRILIEPEEVETVALPGTLLKFRIGDRWLLRAGEHRVTAEFDGYHPLDETIEVGAAPDQQLRLRMDKLPGLVTVQTDPQVAGRVLLDNEPLGELPLTDVEVPAGSYTLRVEAPRFLAASEDIEVAGRGEREHVSLSLVPNWAPLTVSSRPGGATLYVDGEEVGETPGEFELEAGLRQLELRRPGYTAWREEVRIEPGEPKSLDEVQLREADGRVRVVTRPDGARVTVNGDYRGEAPLTLTLRPGRDHELVVSRSGYETARRTVSVSADSGRQLEIDLEPVFGEVRVDVQPAETEVWANGRPLGRERELRLQAVPHELEFRLDGYATQTVEVTPRPGFPQDIEVRLLTEEEAREAAIQRTVSTGLDQELRLVDVGSFRMGSPRGEQGRRSNEVQREVELTRRFYLGVREVSNAEFRRFREDHDSGRFSGESLNGDEQPVVNVSWEDAVRFLNWLSRRDGLTPAYEERNGSFELRDPVPDGYRLPTEAEWEWAARHAGRDAPVRFAWGNQLPPPDRSGNFADVSAARLLPTTLVTYNDGYPVSAPVGSFEANPAGLKDMGGNVAEWVHDRYAIPSPGDGDDALTDPTGPDTGRFRVVRGASWKHAGITELRLTYRDYSDRAREDVGFRIARYLE